MFETTIKTSSLLSSTDAIWPCVTLDHWPSTKCDYGFCPWTANSLHSIDLDNHLLRSAVVAFDGRIRLRLGGTLADSVLYNIGPTKNKCIPFSNFTTTERWGYEVFSGCLTMQRWDELNQFSSQAGCSLIFGVNALYGRQIAEKCPVETDCVNFSPHPGGWLTA